MTINITFLVDKNAKFITQFLLSLKTEFSVAQASPEVLDSSDLSVLASPAAAGSKSTLTLPYLNRFPVCLSVFIVSYYTTKMVSNLKFTATVSVELELRIC